MKIIKNISGFLHLALGYIFIVFIDGWINPRLGRKGYPACWFTKELERRGILK